MIQAILKTSKVAPIPIPTFAAALRASGLEVSGTDITWGPVCDGFADEVLVDDPVLVSTGEPLDVEEDFVETSSVEARDDRDDLDEVEEDLLGPAVLAVLFSNENVFASTPSFDVQVIPDGASTPLPFGSTAS
jgi:hypothetical protein